MSAPTFDWLASGGDREEMVEQRDRARAAWATIEAMRKAGASERVFERGGILLWHPAAPGHAWVSSKFFEWVAGECNAEPGVNAYALCFESEGTTFDGVRHLHIMSEDNGYVFYPWDGDFFAALEFLRTTVNPKPA